MFNKCLLLTDERQHVCLDPQLLIPSRHHVRGSAFLKSLPPPKQYLLEKEGYPPVEERRPQRRQLSWEQNQRSAVEEVETKPGRRRMGPVGLEGVISRVRQGQVWGRGSELAVGVCRI